MEKKYSKGRQKYARILKEIITDLTYFTPPQQDIVVQMAGRNAPNVAVVDAAGSRPQDEVSITVLINAIPHIGHIWKLPTFFNVYFFVIG